MSAAFQELWSKAVSAGIAACTASIPTPMVVSEGDVCVNGESVIPRGQQWYVSDGACGFAWVEFPGNDAFGRWAKKSGFASKYYPSGLCYWVSHGGQSIARKEAFAKAMADVLKAGGVKAWANSRLD